MRKACVYPLTKDILPYISYLENAISCKIENIVTVEGLCLVDEDASSLDNGIPLGRIVCSDVAFFDHPQGYDLLIISPFNKLPSKAQEQVLSNTVTACKNIKEIIILSQLNENQKSSLEKACVENKLPWNYYGENKSYLYLEKTVDVSLKINIPIILVCSLFDDYIVTGTVLAIAKQLKHRDSNCLVYGNDSFCELLGFNSLPKEFLDDNIAPEVRINILKKAVYHDIKELSPDCVIIQVTGSLIPYSDRVSVGYGMIPYMISQAFSASYLYCCLPYELVMKEFVDRLNTICHYKFGLEIDGLICSNILIDGFGIQQTSEMSIIFDNYLHVNEYLNKLQKNDDLHPFIPLYNYFDKEFASKIIETM